MQEGNIPLFSAVDVGNLSVSRELLLTHTQVDNTIGITAVLILTSTLLQSKPPLPSQEQLKAGKGPEEDQALHLAARKGDNDLVKLFIESGTRVDTQNVSGRQLPHHGIIETAMRMIIMIMIS